MLNVPLLQVAFLLVEINPHEDKLFSAASIPVSIVFVPNLPESDFRALIALEFNNVDLLRKDDHKINPSFAGQDTTLDIYQSGCRHYQVKNGVEIGLITF